MKKSLVIAHRGASGYAPENTIASFRKALEMKADGIELDVHLNREGHLIVCHDEAVNRTTNGTGLIKDLSLREIQEMDAGSWFHKAYAREGIPTLDEVLELIKNKNILINIELKSGPILYEGIEKQVIQLLKKYNLQNQAILSSFNHYSLLECKKADNGIKTAILYMAGLVDPWEYAKYIKADGIHPYFYTVTPTVIEGCEQNNMFIYPFTVNDDQYMKQLFHYGISGIITNYPDRAKKILKEQ